MSFFDRFKRHAKAPAATATPVIARVAAARPKVPSKAVLEARELFLGVTEGNSRYVRQLLGRGCDPQGEAAQDHEQRSPLHEAVCHNHLGVTMALLDYGADVDAQDATGATPLLVAVRNYPRSLAVIEVLQFSSADPLVKDKNGMNALKAAQWTEGFPQELLTEWRAQMNETGPLALA
ncbi:ankyrin repeat domain-containing protein [Micrococcales bacterium 31B]|nr:ankyrin repeat domain-containing protein [Micrococcales bacterium 31B]